MKKIIYGSPLFFDLFIPLGILAVLAPFTPLLDIKLASYFHDFNTHQFSENPFFTFFYRWGLLPGQFVGLMAFFLFLLSFFDRWKKWRKPALAIGLTIALGAGLITHVILKEHWKRPRPKQVEMYGGSEAFKPFYQPNFAASGNFKSFPSGHCTMGFCFFSFLFLGRRWKSRPLFFSGLLLSLGLGFCLSLSRIAQGGHFFSDTLVAACLMWMVAAFCDWFIYSQNSVSCDIRNFTS